MAPFHHFQNNKMITKAIARAYRVMHERNWDTIYWAVDLHGVCLKSNYENGGYEFINEEAKIGLQHISMREENKIILWSSCHDHEKQAIIDFFADNAIHVDHFNVNPDEANTKTGCFDQKFYFSVLLDDKAGFDPDEHWAEIIEYYEMADYTIMQDTPPKTSDISTMTKLAMTFASGASASLLVGIMFPLHPYAALEAFVIAMGISGLSIHKFG